jgi:HlyD family secretion protein
MIPNASLRFTHQKDENAPKYKHQGVWVLQDKKPDRINIKTGISDGSYTEIISGNILEGQKVITGTIEKVRESRNRPPGGMRMF